MGTVTNITRSLFSVGDLIHHRLFGYRGVIYDVDPKFQLSDEWYEEMANSRPPKDKPWYHVLVHDAIYSTYVAEQNLERDDSQEPIDHPLIDEFFTGFENGHYIRADKSN